MSLPLYKNLSITVLKALNSLGGKASTRDIEEVVAAMLALTPEEISAVHKGKQTKLHNRVAWSRYYLKTKGYIDSTERGIYTLTEKGETVVVL